MMFKRSEYCLVKDITSSDIYDGQRYTLQIIYFCLAKLFCQTSKMEYGKMNPKSQIHYENWARPTLQPIIQIMTICFLSLPEIFSKYLKS